MLGSRLGGVCATPIDKALGVLATFTFDPKIVACNILNVYTDKKKGMYIAHIYDVKIYYLTNILFTFEHKKSLMSESKHDYSRLEYFYQSICTHEYCYNEAVSRGDLGVLRPNRIGARTVACLMQ